MLRLELTDDLKTGIDTIVLDDAVQHRWIKRDLDMVIIEQRFLASNDFFINNLKLRKLHNFSLDNEVYNKLYYHHALNSLTLVVKYSTLKHPHNYVNNEM